MQQNSNDPLIERIIQKQKKQNKAVTIFLSALVGLIFIAAIVSVSKESNTENTKSYQSENSSDQTKKLPPMPALTAKQLNAAYHENEVVADNAYKGKWILINGHVTSIQKDFLDEAYITLSTGVYFQDVTCYLPADEAALIRKGDDITLIGKCMGMTMGMVNIKDATTDGKLAYKQITNE